MSDFLLTIELAADVWGVRLLQASWQGAVILAVVWILARGCVFISPRVVCWFWRLACLKLLVALFWVEPIGLPLLPAMPARTMPRETLVTPTTTEQIVQTKPRVIDAIEPVNQIEPQPRAAVYRISWLRFYSILWLAGFCGCLMITVKHWIAIRRLCRAADPVQSTMLRHSLQLVAERLGIRRMPDLRISPCEDGPLLAQIVRPTIILPSRIEETFDESEVQLMLAHELAHLKRRDLLWNWLPTIVGWLFWFHPLVWLMKRHWREAQEGACDEILIQKDVTRPVEYGRLLVKLASGWQRQPAAALLVVRMFGSYHYLKQRIVTMTHVRAFSNRRLAIAAVILGLVAVPSIVPWRLVAQESDQAAQPAVTLPTAASTTQNDAAVEKSKPDPKFKEVTERGLAAFKKHDYAQALACFEEGVLLDPNHSEVRRWRGDALLNQDELDKALSNYDEAIRLDPKNAKAYVSRGIAFTEKRKLGPALVAFGTALELDPKQADRPAFKRYVAAAQSILGPPPAGAFGHPERETSPFSAVRWHDSEPEVKVNDEWFKLISLNGIPVSEILDFARKKLFGGNWKMRFEEDLVELLTRMGHPPKETATLVVQSKATSEQLTLKDVPMTSANRWKIKRAGDARRASELTLMFPDLPTWIMSIK